MDKISGACSHDPGLGTLGNGLDHYCKKDEFAHRDTIAFEWGEDNFRHILLHLVNITILPLRSKALLISGN